VTLAAAIASGVFAVIAMPYYQPRAHRHFSLNPRDATVCLLEPFVARENEHVVKRNRRIEPCRDRTFERADGATIAAEERSGSRSA
jgi:hypothetical protein